jgi:hypothetical protein
VVSGGTTKQITTNQVLGSGGTATLASATITGALTSGTTTLVAHAAGYTGKVGIGTATPAYKLDVSSATASNQLRISGSSQNSMVFANAAAGPSNGFLVGRSIGSDDSNNLFFYDLATSAVRLFIGSTGNIGIGTGVTPGEALEVSSGNVKLNNGNVVMGTSGKGIDFSAKTPDGSGTVGNEILNDYEEGTWVPVVADAATGGNVGTCTAQNAQYTKIGNLVTISFYISSINTTGMTGGNGFYVRGLPFTSTRVGTGAFYTYRVRRNASTVSSAACVFQSTSSILFLLFTVLSATADTYLTVSDMVSGTSEMQLSLTYTVA